MDEASDNEFFDQFPSAPRIVPTHSVNDYRELLEGLRQEISAMQLMESIWTKALEAAENEVRELEAQWLLEVPNGTKTG